MVDYDAIVGARGTASYKWDRYGPDVLPFWVADMDLPRRRRSSRRSRREPLTGLRLLWPDSLPPPYGGICSRATNWDVAAEWLSGCRRGARPQPGLPRLRGGRETVLTVVRPTRPSSTRPVCRGGSSRRRPRARRAGAGSCRSTSSRRRLRRRHACFCSVIRTTRWGASGAPRGSRSGRALPSPELVLVSDEIHCDLLLEPARHLPSVLAAAGAEELTVTLMAPSKTFNLPA